MTRSALAICTATLLATSLSAQTFGASFDGNPEGLLGTVVVENGIVVSDLDRFLGTSPDTFVAEDASQTLAGMPHFSAPIALGFGTFQAGPTGQLARCGSFKITPPIAINRVQVRFFVEGASGPNSSIFLWLRKNGTNEGLRTLTIPQGPGPHLLEFVASSSIKVFDELFVTGMTGGAPTAFYGVMDSVVLSYVPTAVRYCFGDGTATVCPCGNASSAPNGCANSTGTGGTLFGIIGVDSLLFVAGDLPPNKPALLFRGTQQANAGMGVTLGDGLLCIGGAITRNGVTLTDASGTATWDTYPEPIGNTTRHYQVWYRDNSMTAPCGSGYNLTSALTMNLGF